MLKQKKDDDAADAGAGRRLLSGAHGAGLLALILTMVILTTIVIITAAMWFKTRNVLETYRVCIDAHQYKVQPQPDISEVITPEPYAYGYLEIDLDQLEMRWRIVDVLGSASPEIVSVDIRGPLSQAHSQVAGVAMPLTTVRDARGRFAATVELNGMLLKDIINRPYAYYVSFSTSSGQEIARDSLDKSCPHVI